MNLKPYLICQMCTKILKNPITLACGHTLCEEHLQENKALNENKLECVSCNQVYDLNNNNNNHIVRVQILQEILREKCFLSNEENFLNFLNLSISSMSISGAIEVGCF